MAVQMPCAGLFMMHRLMHLGTSRPVLRIHRHIFLKLTTSRREIRNLSTGCVKHNENERDSSDPSPSSTELTSRQALLSKRRRSLSPLERISSLLPQDVLSDEVIQLREQNLQPEVDTSIQSPFDVLDSQCRQEENPLTDTGDEAMPKADGSHICHASDGATEQSSEAQLNGERWVSPALPGESRLAFGELLVAEFHKKRRVQFRKMFQLQTGTRLQSSWGVISHDDIAGQPAGRFLNTNRGVPILIRRASLEDYVLHMRRGPAISYPKDAGAMLMMMDVTEGDHVLESGSGSGAMSLFLSRAVGSRGRVTSVEVREDHCKRAVLNYKRWRTSWSVRRGDEWPDNVQFHNADLCTASSLLAGQGFNAVALDLISPHLVLPTVIPHLHPGAVCAVYIANITQVIDLLEGLRCLPLPVLCERIIEVPIRDWLVAPAIQKDGRYCSRKAPIQDEAKTEEDDDFSEASDEEEQPAFGSVPYIARPHPEQMSHTAFLVKLRKCVR